MLLSVLVKRGWTTVQRWREISRERNELRRLSESLAKDIGISRAEAEREADRPFWDYDQTTQGSLPVRGNPVDRSCVEKNDGCLQN